MSEVVTGEIVETRPSPPDAKLARTVNALKPAKCKAILAEIDERMERGEYNFTLSTIARRNGISPATFTEAIHRAFEYPDHKLHRFAKDIQARWAECEEFLYGKMLSTAEAKGKWEGLATALERTRPDDWKRPSQSSATQVLQIGVVEKLALLQQGQGELQTGD